tara:strand:- start:7686 stop:8123 length:438 start_codon:yes stop_codon:yes gene_type:complete
MPLRQIVYISSGTREYRETELEEIARASGRNNARTGVTGMLLHYNGNFMQLLEGEADAVEDTFARISADSRHSGILKLQDEEISRRRFPDSRMGFRAIAESEMTSYPDLFEKRGTRWDVKTDADIDQKLIVLFRTFFKINAGKPA